MPHWKQFWWKADWVRKKKLVPVSLRLRRTLKSFTSEPLRGILDIKLPWAACCDIPFTLQTAASVTETLFLPQKCSTRKQKWRREQAWGQKLMTLMLNVTMVRPASQPALHAFVSYLLLRILLRHCVYASVSDDSVGAGAAVGSVSGSPVSTRAWPSPRDAWWVRERFDVNCCSSLLASST